MSLINDEITAKNFKEFYKKILPYLVRGNNGYSETPIGAMQMFDDDTAPSGWLIADGTVYNISDYPFLAKHFERVHGSKNYYGGDGITTFAVPDWQGEFFRASGTNSHENQGSGGTVGEHQDATEIPKIFFDRGAIGQQRSGTTNVINKSDSEIGSSTVREQVSSAQHTGMSELSTHSTVRPTNTSLLCCIKAVPAGVNYSLEEQEIGTWVDGKPLYQKTYEYESTELNKWVSVADLTALNIDACMFGGSFVSGNIKLPLPYQDSSNHIWIQQNNSKQLYVNTTISGKLVIVIQYTKTTD